MIPDDVKADIAKAVRTVHFAFGPGGTCGYRIATGLFALRTVLQSPATPCFGSMIFRAGPDPVRDVMAFCGPGNAGCWSGSNQLLGHGWIQLGDELIDFTAGDWRHQHIDHGVPEGMSPSPAEAKVLDPIEWTAMPPEYYWQNARSLTGPWKPKGEPEIGQAWYGPFKIDAQTNGRIEEKRSIETLRLPGRIRGYRQAALREASGAA